MALFFSSALSLEPALGCLLPLNKLFAFWLVFLSVNFQTNKIMKKLLKTAMFLACAALYFADVHAQEWVKTKDEPVSLICISETVNEAPDVVEIFQTTQSNYYHDPRAPRFVLVDQKGKWGLGIGGYLQVKAEYDFSGSVDNVDFFPSEIDRRGVSSSQFQMDMTNSTIFLKLVGNSRLLGDFYVYTSANWRGTGDNFRLHNMYMSSRNLLLGYTVGTFMDLDAAPVTVDYGGPCGMAFYRTTQLRLSYVTDMGLSMGLGLEASKPHGTSNASVTITSQRMPDIPVYVQYAFNEDSHFRVAGVVRNLSYRNLLNGEKHNKYGWGAQASMLATMGKFQLKGQFTMGKGIGSYINNVSNVGVDLVPAAQEGKMTMLRTDAWYVGLQYNASSRFFATATYSQTTLHSAAGYATAFPEAYRRGQYVVANMFMNASENMQIGVEYLHGWRTDFNGEKCQANRINLSARYNF